MSDMVKKAKTLPRHKSEDQEREFWSKSDSTDYIDWSDARPLVLPNLKPSLKTISLRLPEHMLAELKVLANKRDVPYQSLLKLFLAERLEEECHSQRDQEMAGPVARRVHDRPAQGQTVAVAGAGQGRQGNPVWRRDQANVP